MKVGAFVDYDAGFARLGDLEGCIVRAIDGLAVCGRHDQCSRDSKQLGEPQDWGL